MLSYRVAPYHYPSQLHDVQRALQFVRAQAAEFSVDAQRIGVIGFSAGGHLAGMAGTKVAAADPAATDPIKRVSSRPDFMILAYPVISMKDGVGHAGSRHNLLGADPSAELDRVGIAKTQVRPDTPPTFIFQTDADTVVTAENSILFYSALRKAGVAAEFHSFREGHTGSGLTGTRARRSGQSCFGSGSSARAFSSLGLAATQPRSRVRFPLLALCVQPVFQTLERSKLLCPDFL